MPRPDHLLAGQGVKFQIKLHTYVKHDQESISPHIHIATLDSEIIFVYS